jgi:NADPH-dependent 2,4-dienoyl-CoA reductase/sulfur reductase-like enzyme
VNTEPHVVIVGAGAAGHAAASTLRKEGYPGPITLIHPEPQAPYNRTLVNKGILPGLLTPEQIALPGLDSFDVDLVSATATGIDAGRAVVLLDDGRQVPFGTLIVATGSQPRSAASRGHRPAGRIFHLHSADDGVRIRNAVDGLAAPVVTVLGAGFIGAETASHFAQAGATVNLVSRPTLPMAATLGEPIARRVSELHHQHVNTWFGRKVVRVGQGGDSATVTLDGGHQLESDFVVVAHGTAPGSRWAAAEGGVAVDDRLRVVDLPNTYAAGSVAVHNAADGGTFRIDHWDAAVAQGRHAAWTLLHDREGAPDPGPYVPDSGYLLNLYRVPIAVYGVAMPTATQRHETPASGGIITEFRGGDGNLIAVAGLAAGGSLRGRLEQLTRP